MIMHLGGDCYVETKNVLLILDYKEAVKNKDTSLFLAGFPVKTISLPGKAEDKPKSVVVTCAGKEKSVYISPISRRTLSMRGVVKETL